MIENEKGGIRAVLKNDFGSPRLSLGIRVSCMGAGNHGYDRHEHHGYDNGNYRYNW